MKKGDSIIIAVNSGSKFASKDFIVNSPYFEKELTSYLAQKKLSLIGVDVPVIDNQEDLYSAVNLLFKSNENMLLLAPLNINFSKVNLGIYTLVTQPLNIKSVCASLCRPILIS